MRKNYKRMIMALVCAVSLMAQAVTAYAAEERAVTRIVLCDYCQGECVKMETSQKIYSSEYGTMMHTVKQFEMYKCPECIKLKQITLIDTEEPCHWIRYEDLGHQRGEDHKYRLTCGYCHGTHEITLTTCSGADTGKHITPW